MWKVELVNNIGCVIDECFVEEDELTLDEVAKRNWCLVDGDTIKITKE